MTRDCHERPREERGHEEAFTNERRCAAGEQRREGQEAFIERLFIRYWTVIIYATTNGLDEAKGRKSRMAIFYLSCIHHTTETIP